MLHTYVCVCVCVCVCVGAIKTVFHLFNGDSSQIRVSWTICNQYLNSPLSWHRRASRSAIPMSLSVKTDSHYYQLSRLLSVAARIEPTTPCSRGGRSNFQAFQILSNFIFTLWSNNSSYIPMSSFSSDGCIVAQISTNRKCRFVIKTIIPSKSFFMILQTLLEISNWMRAFSDLNVYSRSSVRG